MWEQKDDVLDFLSEPFKKKILQDQVLERVVIMQQAGKSRSGNPTWKVIELFDEGSPPELIEQVSSWLEENFPDGDTENECAKFRVLKGVGKGASQDPSVSDTSRTFNLRNTEYVPQGTQGAMEDGEEGVAFPIPPTVQAQHDASSVVMRQLLEHIRTQDKRLEGAYRLVHEMTKPMVELLHAQVGFAKAVTDSHKDQFTGGDSSDKEMFERMLQHQKDEAEQRSKNTRMVVGAVAPIAAGFAEHKFGMPSGSLTGIVQGMMGGASNHEEEDDKPLF